MASNPTPAAAKPTPAALAALTARFTSPEKAVQVPHSKPVDPEPITMEKWPDLDNLDVPEDEQARQAALDELEGKYTVTMMRVPLTSIIVDPRVQRDLDPKRMRQLAKEFNPALLGFFCLSDRGDGVYHAVDGQHRKHYLETVAMTPHRLVRAEIFHGMTLKDEARLFLLKNNAGAVSYADKFKVRAEQGEPDAVAMMEIITSVGFKVGPRGQRRCFNALKALSRMYAASPEMAALSVKLATDAWGDGNSSVNGSLIEGICMFMTKWPDKANGQPRVDPKRMEVILPAYPGGAVGVISAMRGAKTSLKKDSPWIVAYLLRAAYNKNLKETNQLPYWD